MSAAAKASRINKDVKLTVYEKTDVVSWGACGLPYYVGNFFENPHNLIARSPEKFIESGMDLKINHEVLKVNSDEQKITVKNLKTGEVFEDSYDKLMIATGASAVMPPFENKNLENICYLKEYSDGMNLKKIAQDEKIQDVIIVGGGFIGIELVEAMAHLGKKNIRVIEFADRIMKEVFDKDMTDILEQELTSHENVKLHVEEKVLGFVGINKVTGVKTNKGEYKADLVIIAVGIRPNTNIIEGAEKLSNGALIINSSGETSIKNIYAAGDCASVYHILRKENVYLPLATTANKIGRIVGENLGGLTTKFEGTLGSACVKVMDLEAGRTGLTEQEAIKNNIPHKVVFIKDKNHTNYYPEQYDLWVKLIYSPDTRIILGGQIVGKQGAVLRTDVISVAIKKEMTVDELGMQDFCYSPPFARTWDILNIAGNGAK